MVEILGGSLAAQAAVVFVSAIIGFVIGWLVGVYYNSNRGRPIDVTILPGDEAFDYRDD